MKRKRSELFKVLCGDQREEEDITTLMKGLSFNAEISQKPSNNTVLGKRTAPSLRYEWRFNKKAKRTESMTMHGFMAQHFNSLPTDVIHRIFSSFEDESLTTLWRISLVCKIWMREVWASQHSLNIRPLRFSRTDSFFSKLRDCELMFNFHSLRLEFLQEITVQAPIFQSELSLFAQLKNLRVIRVLGIIQAPTAQILDDEILDKETWSVSLVSGEELYFPTYHLNFSRSFFPRIYQMHIEVSISGGGNSPSRASKTRCFRLIKVASPNLEILLSDVFSGYGASFSCEIYKWLNSHEEFTIPLFYPFPKRRASHVTKPISSDLILTSKGDHAEKLLKVVLRITGGWLFVSEEWDE